MARKIIRTIEDADNFYAAKVGLSASAINHNRDFWDKISINYRLSDEFILKHLNNLDMEYLIYYQKLSDEVVRQCVDIGKPIHNSIFSFQTLNEDLIEKIIYNKSSNEWETCWSYISSDQDLSLDFMKKHCVDLDWSKISRKQKLSEYDIIELSGYLDWKKVCKYQTITNKILKMFPKKISWANISKYQLFSIDTYKEFCKKFKWKNVTISFCTKTAPVQYFEEFKDLLDWDIISRRYCIDTEFCKKFKNYINFAELTTNYTIKDLNVFLVKPELVDWDYISHWREIPKDFVIKNHKYINFECLKRNPKLDYDVKNIESQCLIYDSLKL